MAIKILGPRILVKFWVSKYDSDSYDIIWLTCEVSDWSLLQLQRPLNVPSVASSAVVFRTLSSPSYAKSLAGNWIQRPNNNDHNKKFHIQVISPCSGDKLLQWTSTSWILVESVIRSCHHYTNLTKLSVIMDCWMLKFCIYLSDWLWPAKTQSCLQAGYTPKRFSERGKRIFAKSRRLSRTLPFDTLPFDATTKQTNNTL
jgi:hypothetical protein